MRLRCASSGPAELSPTGFAALLRLPALTQQHHGDQGDQGEARRRHREGFARLQRPPTKAGKGSRRIVAREVQARCQMEEGCVRTRAGAGGGGGRGWHMRDCRAGHGVVDGWPAAAMADHGIQLRFAGRSSPTASKQLRKEVVQPQLAHTAPVRPARGGPDAVPARSLRRHVTEIQWVQHTHSVGVGQIKGGWAVQRRKNARC